MRKEFKINEKERLQLRVAAFNFLNRANYTFSSLYPVGYSMNFNEAVGSSNLSQRPGKRNGSGAFVRSWVRVYFHPHGETNHGSVG